MPSGVYIRTKPISEETREKMRRPNSGQFKHGNHPITEFKKGEHFSPETEFKKGQHVSESTEFKAGKESIFWKGGKRISRAKTKAKRRQFLGYIPLNECRDSSWEGHHIDKDYVIFIPKELHQSIRHSVIKNKNMDLINDKVYEWFIDKYLNNNIKELI